MLLIVGFIGAISVILLATRDWRLSVKVALVLVVFEGALRKWVLPEASELIYFLKDFILLGAYVKYFTATPPGQRTRLRDAAVTTLLGLVAFWCGMQAFNPSIGSPIVGLFGMRAYLMYAPLMWLLPSLFRSEAELYQFLRWYLLLTLPVLGLAVLQYASPGSSWLNVYASGEEANATFGGGGTNFVRVTGTFSYLAGFGAYVIVCFALLLPQLTVEQRPLWRRIQIVQMMGLLAGSIVSGSRGVPIVVGVTLAAYVFFSNFSGGAVGSLKVLRQLLIPLAIAAGVALTRFADAFTALGDRFGAPGSSEELLTRIWFPFTVVTEQLFAVSNIYGTGAAHQATPVLRAVLGLPGGDRVPFAEGEAIKILLELGAPGLLLWIALKVAIVLALWRAFRSLRRPFLQQLALVAFVYHLTFLPYGGGVFNHTVGIYYWFLASFAFLLPQIQTYEDWCDYYWALQQYEAEMAQQAAAEAPDLGDAETS